MVITIKQFPSSLGLTYLPTYLPTYLLTVSNHSVEISSPALHVIRYLAAFVRKGLQALVNIHDWVDIYCKIAFIINITMIIIASVVSTLMSIIICIWIPI